MADENTQQVTPTSENNTEQNTQREAVQNKYERIYGQTPPQQETPAQESAPAEVAPPVVDPNAALLAELQSLRAEVNSLKPKPVAPKPVVTTPWFEELRAGNFEGAEANLVERIKASVSPEATRLAVAEAVETMKIQNEIDRYLTDLRGQNPDVVPMERYLRAPVEARLIAANDAGKIKNGLDYVREYKLAVDEEVKEIRKVTGQYRAAGKQEAITRTSQVMQASTLQPQSVNNQNSQQGNEEPQVVTTEDYLTMRKQQNARMRGMGF